MLPKKTCTGCSACMSICPKNCICMTRNTDGFLYPKIDTKVCVNCGLCEKICPVIKEKNQEQQNQEQQNHPTTYAASILNEEVRKNSSSGGIFTVIAEQIIESNGMVYGAAFSEDLSVKHIGVTNTSDLDKLRRSKYVQSDLNGCFKEIKEQLENNTTVLFSGTPCQVGGLLSYLQKPYENLITLDFVCHGVPSPKVWEEYLSYQEKAYNSKIIEVNFRDKSKGWKTSSISLVFKNGKNYKKGFGEDTYMKAFLSNISLRSSCYGCKYKSTNRKSDLTLADYWGIDKVNPSLDDNKGLSMVLVQSKKGEELLNKARNSITLTETDVTEVFTYNPCIIKSVYEHNFRQYFFNRLGKTDFQKLVNNCLSPSYLTRLHRKLLQLKGGEN